MKKKPEAEADVKGRGKLLYHGSGGGRSDGSQS